MAENEPRCQNPSCFLDAVLAAAVASELEPYRGKMGEEQLATLERQYRERWLSASNGLQLLSLSYLRVTELAA